MALAALKDSAVPAASTTTSAPRPPVSAFTFATGTAESFNAASAMIRHNGKFVFYSWVTTPVNLNISRWHDDGLEFVNTCLVHHTWQERYVWVPDTLRPIIQGSVKIHPLITNEFRLENIRAGFDLADKDDAAIKIVFRP